MQPTGYPKHPQENTLEFEPSRTPTLVVIVRYYVTKGGETAGVPLPMIEAFDVWTQQSVPLPQQYFIEDRPLFVSAWLMRPILTTNVDNTAVGPPAPARPGSRGSPQRRSRTAASPP